MSDEAIKTICNTVFSIAIVLGFIWAAVKTR